MCVTPLGSDEPLLDQESGVLEESFLGFGEENEIQRDVRSMSILILYFTLSLVVELAVFIPLTRNIHLMIVFVLNVVWIMIEDSNGTWILHVIHSIRTRPWQWFLHVCVVEHLKYYDRILLGFCFYFTIFAMIELILL
jgi:hypothetical protein